MPSKAADSRASTLSVSELKGKEGLVVDGRFKLTTCIGVGGFVYSAKDLQTEATVAVKLEHLEFEWASIQLEVEVYTALQSNPSKRHAEFFPAMIATGVHDEMYRYLVMELLEKSLNQTFKASPKRLTVRQVAKHAKHLIKALELMHDSGYVHSDLSLKNILIDNQVTRLVDFGLANPWRDKVTGAHKRLNDDWNYAGTVRFASIHALRSYRPTRRDDVESLAYILVYLIKRKLPWEVLNENEEDQWTDIADMKYDMKPSEVCEGLPVEFANFLAHARSLAWDEQPDYATHRRAFHEFNEAMRAAEQKATQSQIQHSVPRKLIPMAPAQLERLAAALPAASPLRNSIKVVDRQNTVEVANLFTKLNLGGAPGSPGRPASRGSFRISADDPRDAEHEGTPLKPKRLIVDLTALDNAVHQEAGQENRRKSGGSNHFSLFSPMHKATLPPLPIKGKQNEKPAGVGKKCGTPALDTHGQLRRKGPMDALTPAAAAAKQRAMVLRSGKQL